MTSIEDLLEEGPVITRVKSIQSNTKLHHDIKKLSKDERIIYWITEYAIENGQKDLMKALNNDCSTELMSVLRKTSLNERYLMLTLLSCIESLEDANPTKKTSIAEKSLTILNSVISELKVPTATANELLKQMKAKVISCFLDLSYKAALQSIEVLKDDEEGIDPELEEDMKQLIEKSQSGKLTEEGEFLKKIKQKYNFEEKFIPAIIKLAEDVESSFPQPFLETVEEERLRRSKRKSEKGVISSEDIKEALGNSKELLDPIWKGKQTKVRMWKKRVKAEKALKPTSEQMESTKEAKQVVESLKESSGTLKEVGEDPLQSALKEAPRRRRSEVAPRSVFSKDPKKRRLSEVAINLRQQELLEDLDEEAILPNPKRLSNIKETLYEKKKREKTTTGRRFRRAWYPDEEAVLIAGVAKFGIGNWSDILQHYNFGDRKSVDLKDKWKAMRTKNREDLERRLEIEEQKLKSKRPNK